MPKAPQSKEERLAEALQMHQDGAKMAAILEATGLNYSPVWLYITDAELPTNQRIKPKDQTAATVAKLRDDEQNSWGLISVRFGYKEFGEGKIRGMYEEATGDRSIGLRNGRGGRFLDHDPTLYKDDHKRTGTRIKKTTSRTELRSKTADRGAAKVSGVVKKAATKKATPTKKALAKKVGGVKKVAKKTAQVDA